MGLVSWTTRAREPQVLPELHGAPVGGEGLELDPADPPVGREPGGLVDELPADPPSPVAGPHDHPRELEGSLVREPGGGPGLAVGHPDHLAVLVLGDQDDRVGVGERLVVLGADLVVEARPRGEHPPVRLHPVELLEQGDQDRDVLHRGLPNAHATSPRTWARACRGRRACPPPDPGSRTAPRTPRARRATPPRAGGRRLRARAWPPRTRATGPRRTSAPPRSRAAIRLARRADAGRPARSSSASSAGTVPARVDQLAGRASPTSRGSRWVPPEPGMIPSVISGSPSCASCGGEPEVAREGDLAARRRARTRRSRRS